MIQDCYATGNVTGTNSVGVLTGSMSAGMIQDCYAVGNVTGTNSVGGLTGSMSAGMIQDCYAVGNVVGESNVGGCLGYIINSTIQSSYSSVQVNGIENVGGFIGLHANNSMIQNSYSCGDVIRINGDNTTFGGFCGYNSDSKIFNSYSLGKAIQSQNGFIWTDRGFLGGLHPMSNFEMTGNFFCTETSEATSSQGIWWGSSQPPIGLDIAHMQFLPTFTNAAWDFNEIWFTIPEYNMYPRLRGVKDIYANTTKGFAPLTVNFHGLSGNENQASWFWDFGDGETSTLQNPSHQYTTIGVFAVSLTVNDGQDSYTIIKPNYVTTTGHLSSFQLIAPSTFTTDLDVFPKFEWSSINTRDMIPFHYKVYLSTNPSFPQATTTIYQTQNTYLYPPKDLRVNTTYFWKVKACFEDNTEILADMGGQAYWMLTTVPQTAQTFPMINGLIQDDRTLRKENSPYWFSVNPGTDIYKNLTIEAGVELRFASNVGLTLRGNLYCNGAVADSILMMGYNDNTYWNGINIIYDMSDNLEVNDTSYLSGNRLNYVIAKNINGIFLNSPNTNFYISNSRINNTDRAINCGEGSYFFNNSFSGSTTGIDTGIIGGVYFSNNVISGFYNALSCNSQATIINNQVVNNRGNGITGGSLFTDCIVTNNGGYGITCETNALLDNVMILNNNGQGIIGGLTFIDCEINYNTGSGVTCSDNATFLNSIISGNQGYGVSGGIQFSNCTVSNNGSYGVNCNTEAELFNTTISGNNDHGINGGLNFTNCTVSNNGDYGVSCNTLAFLSNCIISGNLNYAIFGGRSFTDCDFINNRGENTITVNTLLPAYFINNNFQNNASLHRLILLSAESLSFIDNDISYNTTTSFHSSNRQMMEFCLLTDAVLNSNNMINNICAMNLFKLNAETLDFDSNNVVSNQVNNLYFYYDNNGLTFNVSNTASMDNNLLKQNTFRDNLIELQNATASYTLTNNFITYNNALLDTGLSILKCFAGNVTFNYNTISFNQLNAIPEGKGAIWAYSGNVSIDRNTLTNNTAISNASAIYIENQSTCIVTKNLITNNNAPFALWGTAHEIRDNNFYRNLDINSQLKNIRYTSPANKSYLYNFWGTRSDQGNINPTLYHNNYESSLGVLTYQPIRTAPSPFTPSQMAVVDNVLITSTANSMTPVNDGVFLENSINICVIGEDGNAFSQDITEVSVINMTTGFPLQPFLWETGVNTGIFRGTIYLSNTVYNPQQNILAAAEGDILRIQSTIDPGKVCYIPVIVSRPSIVLPDSFTLEEDSHLVVDFSLYTSDPENDSLSVSVSGNQNITVSIAGMSITFGTLANWTGTETITFTVDDNHGSPTSSDLVTLIVTPVNDAPMIALPTDFSCHEDIAMVLDFSGFISDIDNALSELVLFADNSDHIFVSIDGHQVTLTPALNWSGTETLSFTVNDGVVRNASKLLENRNRQAGSLTNGRASDNGIVSVTFAPMNDAPHIVQTITPITFDEDTVFNTLNLNTIFSDVDLPYGDHLSYSVSQHEGINTVINNGQVTITPNTNWHGTHTLTFVATDDSLATISTDVVLTVNNVNDAPAIAMGNLFICEDQPLIIDASAYISDIDNDISELIISGISSAHINVNIQNHIITFTPEANWSGMETLTFTVDDGVLRKGNTRLNNSQTIEFTVYPMNDTPHIVQTITPITFDEDTIFNTLNLNTIFSDVDLPYGDHLAYSVSQHEGITTTINSGLVTITPNANWYGIYTLTFTATDDSSAFVSTDVVVTVSPVNDAPVLALPQIFSFDEDTILQVDFTPFISDIDTPMNQLSLSSQNTEHLNVQVQGFMVTIVPALNWNGSENLTFSLSDQGTVVFANASQDQRKRLKSTISRETVNASVLITVNPINDAPILVLPDSISFNEDTLFNFDVSPYISDVDNQSFVITTNQSSHFNYIVQNQNISIAPANNWFGQEYLFVTVNDMQTRASVTDSMLIIVHSINDTPVIQSVSPDSVSIHIYTHIPQTFTVIASDVESPVLQYTWSINNAIVGSDSTAFTHLFDTEGDYTVKALISDGEDTCERSWIVYARPLSNTPSLIFKNELSQNYPNPFNPTTMIRFSLKKETRVQLNIYNAKGQLVRILTENDYPAGLHTVKWDGKDDHGSQVSSGVYLYRIESSEFNMTRKMLMMK